jgi:hypothetical protein
MVVTAAVFTGCVPESKEPAGVPVADASLVGSWQGLLNGDQPVLLHIAPAPGGTNLDFVQVLTEADKGAEVQIYTGFPSRCGAVRCLNLRPMKWIADNKAVNEQSLAATNYFIVRYDLATPGALTLWTMEKDEVTDAITAGKLKGSVPEKDSPVITASSEQLSSFIAAANPAVLFSNRYSVFQKIPPPK